MQHPIEQEHLEVAEEEQRGLLRARNFEATGRGYALEHATRPSTISLVLSSNPIALLAW
jgi:microsomal epoxide hydrolase